MSETERRRRRAPISCTLCRRRKIKCDRGMPCSNCVRSRNGTCAYDDGVKISPSLQSRHSDRGAHAGIPATLVYESTTTPTESPSSATSPASAPGHQSRSIVAASTAASTVSSDSVALSRHGVTTSVVERQAFMETSQSRLAGVFHVHHESSLPGQAHVTRSVGHKSRLFGQSHWINGVILFHKLFDKMEPLVREENSKAFAGMQKCKALAKVIKSQREPQWPPVIAGLPSKDVSDELIDCYLNTSENLYRILHVPSFRRDYEAFWIQDSAPDPVFMIQLKLVLAIGSITYDNNFSLRASAIQLVYEAQHSLSKPDYKSQLNIRYLQANLLLLLAREIVGVSEDLIWITAGAVLRTAIYMGLHRDPAGFRLSKRTAFATEMRRRIWNTVLEMCLQSSITSGGPPLISLQEFDTLPPSNLDDDQLTVAEEPVPRPEHEFTQVSVAIALRKTLPVRLAIVKSLNSLRSGTYQETLRLDAEFRTSYMELRHTFQRFSNNGTPPSTYDIRVVDFITHRYLSALHIPFLGPALRETMYAYSRKVVIETSLKIWCAAHLSSAALMARDSTSTPEKDNLARLTICGSGFFRTVTLQASLLIAVELQAQLREEEDSGPVPLRPDLFSVLKDAQAWSLRCVEVGETNFKGYLLMCVVVAQIKGLIQGTANENFAELLVQAAEEAAQTCLPLLEDRATREQANGATEDIYNVIPNQPQADVMEDWDFMMSDVLFNYGAVDPMSWGLDEMISHESVAY
ncbi:hypothetical protein ONS95_011583 [Cadophora gregata]|uniref:uncharacterized protein n=1 Tax=Cadophora gregata TaxID=51156 RepID=UPI0026DC6C04|nr:uncharacterized protein ONS95_011583 [Cadophora gregata]KAK0120177.1 hypothetical protein ONS95_011583 [Cadophora gregata]KAK0121205.1 hypothetical protein ONS96_011384 [Cadophora gregata f. sp. sojae]